MRINYDTKDSPKLVGYVAEFISLRLTFSNIFAKFTPARPTFWPSSNGSRIAVVRFILHAFFGRIIAVILERKLKFDQSASNLD